MNVSLYAGVTYGIGMMIDAPAYIYYSQNGGNYDGTITSFSYNYNFGGNFSSPDIECCGYVNLYSSFTCNLSLDLPI